MSRPSSSVPHQWLEEGGESRVGRSIWAGSCGAIQGAKMAKITNMTAKTAPVAARGLWRAARGSEMEKVDKVRSYCRILGFATEYSKSVRKFTATYVNPIARMHPCTK